jgi:DNA-directed RNA polymerase subunit beta
VTHLDASLKQIIGSSAALIPFIEKTMCIGHLMGSNQQRQSVPLINPKPPVVGTGMEGVVADNSGQLIRAATLGLLRKLLAMKLL